MSNCSWSACPKTGGLQAPGRAQGVHARDGGIAHGVGTVCMAMVGGSVACLPFSKGDHVLKFLMLGYITAAWWGWGTHQHPPGGLGSSVELLVP